MHIGLEIDACVMKPAVLAADTADVNRSSASNDGEETMSVDTQPRSGGSDIVLDGKSDAAEAVKVTIVDGQGNGDSNMDTAVSAATASAATRGESKSLTDGSNSTTAAAEQTLSPAAPVSKTPATPTSSHSKPATTPTSTGKREMLMEELPPLGVADVLLLCDLFSTPFTYGVKAVQLLKTAHWLLDHRDLLLLKDNSDGT